MLKQSKRASYFYLNFGLSIFLIKNLNGIIIGVILLFIFSSCNNTKNKMMKGISSKPYCLDTALSIIPNNMHGLVKDAVLKLNSNGTFFVSYNSGKDKIIGKWDLCCFSSDYGNYVFKINGMPEYKSNLKQFSILVDGNPIFFSFKRCQ